MREPPSDVTDTDVAAAVRQHWRLDVDQVEHLPVGFGAHHWRASGAGAPALFVTLDALGTRHDAGSLEGAYAAAAALADLEFVVAPLPTAAGTFTVPFGPGALSATPWVEGRDAGPLGDDLARADVAILARLHAAVPPPSLPRWGLRVAADLAAQLTRTAAEPSTAGPYGERARTAVLARLPDVRRWTDRYVALAEQAADRRWVPTHGEPHSANQLQTANGVVLVDWESLALAPRERDLGPLIAAGYADAVRPDWAMVEMFDLEWRLDEIAQYAAWFAAPHTGTASDAVAIEGLVEELDRPEWSRPNSDDGP